MKLAVVTVSIAAMFLASSLARMASALDECPSCTPVIAASPTIIARFVLPGVGEVSDPVLDGRGTVWFSKRGYGLGAISGSRVRRFPAPGIVGSLMPAPRGGAWFATATGGLGWARPDGRVIRIPHASDERCVVSDLTLDARGDPWVIESCRSSTLGARSKAFVDAYDVRTKRRKHRKAIPTRRDALGRRVAFDVGFLRSPDAFVAAGDGIAMIAGDHVNRIYDERDIAWADSGATTWRAVARFVSHEDGSAQVVFRRPIAEADRATFRLRLVGDAVGGVFILQDHRLCHVAHDSATLVCDGTGRRFGLPVRSSDESFFAADLRNGTIVHAKLGGIPRSSSITQPPA